MVNYNKAVIYKIVPKDLDSKYCYIGSTVDFKKRKSSHKTMCNNPNNKGYNYPIYKHIRDNGGWNEYEMILVEYYPCETKLELHKRERQCKEIYNDNLGGSVPSRTIKEYHEDNKEKSAEQSKEWRQNNKEHNQEYKKEWRRKNKDKIVEYTKEYNIKNKEKMAEKIGCSICKCYIRKSDFKRHTRTNKHIANL